MLEGRLRVDWHNHTRDFSDGRLTVAEVAARAVALGLRLGIADHALRDNARLRTAAQLLAYADALERYPLLRGLEISLGEPRLPDDRWLGRFTHVIASMHAVPVGGRTVSVVRHLNHRAGVLPDPYRPPAGVDPAAYLAAVPALLEETFRRWPVTILGHFTLVPALAARAAPHLVDACLDAVGDLAVRHGVAVEINNKSRVPELPALRRLAARGVLLSFGSDGHEAAGVGDLTYPWQAWAAVGLPSERLLPEPDERHLPGGAYRAKGSHAPCAAVGPAIAASTAHPGCSGHRLPARGACPH